MNELLPIFRTDRIREIKKYEDQKGYEVESQYYRMVQSIKIKSEDIEVEMRVQVSNSDYYFYLTDGGENAYFSIPEIYKLLVKVSAAEGEGFVADLLERQIQVPDEKDKIEYRGIDYSLRNCVNPGIDASVDSQDGAMAISYRKLFILLNVIQVKSNAMFENSVNKKYQDGILRLMKALTLKKENHRVLANKGWKYDEDSDIFLFEDMPDENGEIKKYYLTEGEYNDIMSLES